MGARCGAVRRAGATGMSHGPNLAITAKQRELLQVGRFHFDRAPRQETWDAAHALVKAGLMEMRESGSDAAQYTALNFSITDAGRAALENKTHG